MNDTLMEIWNRHRGKITGAVLGLLLGILIVSFGVLKALFISICIIAGYILGRNLDDQGGVQDFWKRLFRE